MKIVRLPGLLLGLTDGGSLERRVMRLLEARVPWALRWRVVGSTACVAVLTATSAAIGTVAVRQSVAQSAELPPPKLEIISIRENNSGPIGSRVGGTPDGFAAQNAPLSFLLGHAFRDEYYWTGHAVGEPDWSDSVRYDITAKVSDADVKRLQGPERNKLGKALAREVLTERFALKYHSEDREAPIYILTLAKGGSKLAEVTAANPNPAGLKNPDGKPAGKGMMVNSGQINGHAVTLDGLAQALSGMGELGRKVENRTGLNGAYDLELSWRPEQGTQQPDATLPSLFTALEEQLGLRLVPARAPVKTLVIDHIEKPTEN